MVVGEEGGVGPEGREAGSEGAGNGEGRIAGMTNAGSIAATGGGTGAEVA